MDNWTAYLLTAAGFIILGAYLWVIYDLITTARLTRSQKIVWVFVVLFLQAIGLALYLAISPNQKDRNSLSPPPVPTSADSFSSRISGVIAAVAGLLFFIYLSIAYSATPSDPQKAIGYVFIALYCGIFGVFSFGVVRPLFSILHVRHEPARLIVLVCVAIASAAMVTLMIVQHPR